MELDTTALATKDAYALLTSVIVPRPIAWVSTQDGAGLLNLAPFSYFNGLCSDPPLITLAIASRRDGSPKDTLRNIEETGVFCVNLVDETDAVAMNATSAELPPGASEFDHAHVARVPCAAIAGQRVASARAALECRLVEVHRYGRRHKVGLVVGEVIHAHLDDALLLPGASPQLDAARIQPLARLGQQAYAGLGARLILRRPG